MAGNPVEKGGLMCGQDRRAADLRPHLRPCGYLAAAVDAEVSDGERIDMGWDRPVSVRTGGPPGRQRRKRIKVRAIPSVVIRGAGALVGRFNPMVKDMAAMFGWVDTGRYVADPAGRRRLSGPRPPLSRPSPASRTSWATHLWVRPESLGL